MTRLALFNAVSHLNVSEVFLENYVCNIQYMYFQMLTVAEDYILKYLKRYGLH